MANTKIEWADKVWNPVTGCEKISPGCANCYAEKFARRLQNNPAAWPKYLNGFMPTMHYDELRKPIGWQKPSRIFICSMGDLFHEDISFEFIDKVMATIAHCFWHTFLILTKRPYRMLDYFQYAKANSYTYISTSRHEISSEDDLMNFMYQSISGLDITGRTYPLNNLWLGVSAENQVTFDERVTCLLYTPAFIRFLSLEPLLGPVNLYRTLQYGQWDLNQDTSRTQKIHWIIAGGETGSGARPVSPEWVRSLRDQCYAAGNDEYHMPFFFKSWGSGDKGRLIDGKEYLEFPKISLLCETSCSLT
jgi:protein gp37